MAQNPTGKDMILHENEEGYGKKHYLCQTIEKKGMTMEINSKAKKLRIYVSNTDKYKHEPLYQYLARTARELGMSGATIYKGVMGYGTSSDFTSPSLWEFAEKVPVTVEIIDDEAPINDYLQTIKPLLDEQPKGCLITLQDVDVVYIKHGTPS